MGSHRRLQRAKNFFQSLENRGEPMAKFWSPGTGEVVHMPRPPPPSYPPGLPPPPPSPMQGFPPGEWVPPGRGGHQVWPPLATCLAALGLSDSALHTFAAALQGVVAAGVIAEVPSPALSAPTGKVATLSLLHLRFACGLGSGSGPPSHLGGGGPETGGGWRGQPS